ncbi:MAG: rod shape-determining protein [Pyrinomonadaceae bacterium]
MIMRKTSSFFRFNALRDLVSDSMAIDMGSTSTIIAVRGRGIVVDEPSIIAVHKMTGEIVAIGQEAHDMQGREAREVQLAAPLVDGVVADFERTQVMLNHFVRAARSGISHFSRRAVMSVLSGVTHVEQRALLTAAEHSHIGRVYMVEEGLAAAIGAGVKIDDKNASAVVDIGGGSTNVAVVARGSIVYSQAERIGGSDITAVIMDRLRRHHGLIIGELTAERLKIQLASAIEPAESLRRVPVKGRDVQAGTPRAVEVTSGEICEAAQPLLQRLSRFVGRSLADLQPEVAADIYDRGLLLTGGGALLDGMSEFLQRETTLATRMADEPRYAIVRGLMQLYEDPLTLRRVTRNEPSLLLEMSDGAFESL